MTNTELAYLAGLIDGEGCILIFRENKAKGTHQPVHRLRLQITNTCLQVMNWLESQGFYIRERRNLKKEWKRCWVAIMQDAKAGNLLHTLIPYLIIKADEANLAIEFQDRKVNNGRGGVTKDEYDRRESIKVQLSGLKNQKI